MYIETSILAIVLLLVTLNLRALSIYQNWPAGPLPDKLF